jgi:hypothetical protein
MPNYVENGKDSKKNNKFILLKQLIRLLVLTFLLPSGKISTKFAEKRIKTFHF